MIMFYFLDMSDTEIAELQHISRAGVFKNRQVALHNMKKILQEEKQMGKAVAKCPPYRLIASVADGDEKAIEKMLQFYDAYLSKCCLRPLYDEYGNLYIAVDMELKGRIREAMIKKMRAFEVNIK